MSQLKLGSLFGILLVLILLVALPVRAGEYDEEEEEDHEDEQGPVQGDFESDILKRLGPLKSSRVLRTTYYLSYLLVDWYSARQHCVNHDLRLLSIDDLEEDSEITQFLIDENVPRGWTSGNDRARNGKFVWESTQRPMTYTNWHRAGAHKDPKRNCVFTATHKYWGDGTFGWDDENCNLRLHFICEETF